MYTVVTRATAGVAAIVTVVYVTALVLSAEDGPRGLEVGDQVTMIAVAAVSACVVLGVGAVLVRDIVRTEIAQRADNLPERLADALVERLRRPLAKATAERVSGETRHIIEEVAGIIETGLARAHTGGMVAEAGQRGASLTAINGRRGS